MAVPVPVEQTPTPPLAADLVKRCRAELLVAAQSWSLRRAQEHVRLADRQLAQLQLLLASQRHPS